MNKIMQTKSDCRLSGRHLGRALTTGGVADVEDEEPVVPWEGSNALYVQPKKSLPCGRWRAAGTLSAGAERAEMGMKRSLL